jgi:hypothetical protein
VRSKVEATPIMKRAKNLSTKYFPESLSLLSGLQEKLGELG